MDSATVRRARRIEGVHERMWVVALTIIPSCLSRATIIMDFVLLSLRISSIFPCYHLVYSVRRLPSPVSVIYIISLSNRLCDLFVLG